MTDAVREHRRRLTARGFKRVEVSLLAPDADLLRRVAKALGKDDGASSHLRAAIQGLLPVISPIKFDDWLADQSEGSH